MAPPASGPESPRRTGNAPGTNPPVAARPSSDGAEDLLDSYEAHHTDPVLEEVIEEEELPVAAPVRVKADPKGTLITTRSEAEDLRRRIASPGNDEFDVDLEEIDEEEGNIEELALESDPFPVSLDQPAAAPAKAPRATPAPAPSSRPPATPAPSRPTPVPAARVPQALAAPSPSTFPVEVQVDVGPDAAEVQVPIEVDLPAGATRVTLKLRLVLNLGRGR